MFHRLVTLQNDSFLQQLLFVLLLFLLLLLLQCSRHLDPQGSVPPSTSSGLEKSHFTLQLSASSIKVYKWL